MLNWSVVVVVLVFVSNPYEVGASLDVTNVEGVSRGMVVVTASTIPLSATSQLASHIVSDNRSIHGMSDNKSIDNAGNHTSHDSVNCGPGSDDPACVPVLARGYLMYHIGQGIQEYLVPVLVLVGWVGNTLSCIVMLKPHNRHISCCVYMAVLAVSDNICLYVALHTWIAGNLLGRSLSLYECKYIVFMVHLFSHNGIMVIIAMTVDRFVAVRHPLTAASVCTPYRAKVTSCVIFVAMVIYCLQYFFFATLVGQTCVSMSMDSTFTQVLSITGICLSSVVPFTVLLVLNGFIISTIRGRSKSFLKEEGTDSKPNNRASNDTNSGKHGIKTKDLQVSHDN